MSPVNNDDSSGAANSGAGRPLTRKEIRAQEKYLATQGHDIIPPQAFETGRETPAAAADTPEVGQQPVHEQPVHHEPVVEEPVHEEPVVEEPHHEEHVLDGGHEEHVVDDGDPHEYAGMSREETLRRADELQYGSPSAHGYDSQHAGLPPSYADDEAHHVYDDEAGDGLMTGAAAIPTAKGPSKKVRRRRRVLALVVTLAVFVAAIVVGAQFIKPLLGGNTVADYPGPGTGEVTITVPAGAGPKSVAADLQAKQVIANPDNFIKAFAASGGALSPGTFTMRKEMNNADAVSILLNKDQAKVMYFALSAGMRINDSLQAISDGTGVPVPQLKALSDSPAQFGVPAKAKNLEGFLFPGEYRFPVGHVRQRHPEQTRRKHP